MIKFSKEETEILARKIQLYFSEELDQTIGQFPAQFFVDFIAEDMGAYFYNRGLLDAQAAMEKHIETIGEAIYELEMPTDFAAR